MKKLLTALMLLVATITISGCGQKVTLDNIDSIENENEFSTVILGRFIKKTDETKIVKEAKEFSKKFLARNLTHSYKETIELENEYLVYTDEYKEKNEDIIKQTVEFTNEFYKMYTIETSLQNVNYKKVVNIGGDAYVKGVAKIRLVECGDDDVAVAIGYTQGVNSNLPCEFEIKMKYINGDYYVYDYKIINNEGNFLSILSYKNIEDKLKRFGVENEDEIKAVVRKVAYAQNHRDYKVFKGDEDYPYLSESFKAELNKDRDDVKFTKEVYEKYKINTEFISATIKSMQISGDKCKISLDIRTRLVECINNDVAKNLGFPNGIGSETVIPYVYTVGTENGEFKVFNTKQE